MELEVTKFRDLVPIESLPRLVPGFPNPTIEILGEDFSSVEKVLLNEIPSPEFIIVNKHTIYAELPVGARNKLSTVSVVSGKFTKTNKASTLEFAIGNKTRTISGVQKLLQLFTKWMLQTPGSDIFNLERGGGLQELVGKVVSTRRMEPILSSVTRSVQATSTQIRSAQINQPQLPLDERLLSASVLDLDIFEKQMEARLRISITSIAGPSAVSEIAL